MRFHEDNIRILVKGNHGSNCQQSLNEELGTLINRKQGRIPGIEYTSYSVKPYSFDGDNRAYCCFSDNFVTGDSIEFVPAWEISKSVKRDNNTGEFDHFVSACSFLGMDVDEVTDFLSYQIILDYIISNTDRHQNNFGVIRDSDSLVPIRMAPIYDCGNSMFWNQTYIKYNTRELDRIETCSFNKKESELLKHVSNFNLFDISKLPSDEEIYDIYSKDDNISSEKIDVMIKCITYKAKMIEHYQIHT